VVLAGAFVGVFMRLYRTSIVSFSALLLIAAVLLVAGNWHFVSDVVPGIFVGVSAGLLARQGLARPFKIGCYAAGSAIDFPQSEGLWLVLDKSLDN
jgi:uncharacterized membrane protein